MADRPIIFSAPMVQALLAGRKSQTRRILKPQPALGCMAVEPHPDFRNEWIAYKDGAAQHSFSLRFSEGDRLYVRENWKPHSIYAGVKPRDIPQSKVFYQADDGYAPSNTPWVPCIHMPRWASRLTLGVTDVRVQQLWDITKADAIAEGLTQTTSAETGVLEEVDGDLIPARDPGFKWYCAGPGLKTSSCPRVAFFDLWDHLHGKGAQDANPWLVALTFTVHHHNIDAPQEAAALSE